MNRAIAGRPLSGTELKTVLLNDVTNILDMDGMLANHIAYGRVAFEVTIKLHLDNPSYPEHVSKTVSKTFTQQQIAQNPDSGLEAVEPFPLANISQEGVKKGTKRDRKITSPNAARIENEIPIQIEVRQSDGSIEVKSIKYDFDEFDPEALNIPADHGSTDSEVEG